MREGPRKIAIGVLPIVYALAVTAIFLSLFLLIFIGITEKIPLYITTGSRTEIFADQDFVCQEYTVEGLYPGHRAEVTFTESRRYVGQSVNAVSLSVYDAAGKDITYKYAPVYDLGLLQVLPAEYQIQTGSASQTYSGLPLSNEECEITGLLPGHSANILAPAALVHAGNIPNVPELVICDSAGKDVTDQYVPLADYGTLTVLPRSLTIASPTVTRAFQDGPFTPSEYFLEAGSLAEADILAVEFSRTYTQRGEYVNHFSLSVFRDENGQKIDVTHNYILELKFGKITIE